MSIIELEGIEVNFEKKYSSRAKNIKISINCNGLVILTIPKPGIFSSKNSLEQKAIKFLKSKSDWILKHVEKSKNKTPISEEEKINNKDLKINSRTHYLKYKENSRNLCEDRCKYWSNIMGLEYNRISIKMLKTKWGSCSSKKNLNFNYKILFLNKQDQDYLIVHELSHLKHMNHSKTFWDLVCNTLGNEKFRRYKINH